MKQAKLAAIVLLIAGAVLLVLGIYQFVEFRNSFGGAAASIGNRISGAFGGSSKIADGYVKPILLIVGGLVAGGAGFFLFKKNR